MNHNLLNELMQDTEGRLRNICVPLDNGQEPFHIGTLTFSCLDFLTEQKHLRLQVFLFTFVISRQFAETIIGELAGNIILVQTLKDIVKLDNSFFRTSNYLDDCKMN